MKTVVVVFLLLINWSSAFSQLSLQWERKFNGNGGYNYSDEPSATAVDSHGNLIVTGYCYDTGEQKYYITVKYDPSGNLMWSARYDSVSFGDRANSVTSDLSDNVYVTGGNNRLTIIKYSSQGEVMWIVKDTLATSGASIITDQLGNVYVTGSSSGEGVNFMTLKYDINGNRLWHSQYNHPSNNSDYPNKIMLDNSNNVYVTGYTYVSGGGTIATTLKYNSSGGFLWSALYDHASYQDYISSIDIDAGQNVYITGYSNIINSQNDYDFFTVKYGPNGDSLWVRRFDGPGIGNNYSSDISQTIKVDNNNQIIVSGKSGEGNGNNDARLIKYSSDGAELWNRNFNFNSVSNDWIYAMEIDDHDNIYLTGKTDNDCLTLKYNSSGNLVWFHNYNGSGNTTESAKFINLDLHGNPVITGLINQGTTWNDYLTIKYDTAGSIVWQKSFSTPSLSNDAGNCITPDNNGNVIVTGKSQLVNNQTSLITLKYSSSGNLLWQNSFNDSDNPHNEGVFVAADLSGNSYITGYTTDTGTHNKIITLKYDSSGTMLWLTNFEDNDGNSVPRKIIYDNNGNVFVCGVNSVANQGYNILLIKYNALTGDSIWTWSYNGVYNLDEDVTDMSLDSKGNILITGLIKVSTNNTDYLLIKVDKTGNYIWEQQFNKLKSDVVRSVYCDELDNVYITGRTFENVPTFPIGNFYTLSYTVTIKYDSNGIVKWIAEDGSSCGYCYAEHSGYKILTDRYRNVFITGAGTSRFKTIKYDSLGNVIWIKYYTGNYQSNSRAAFDMVQTGDKLIITGISPLYEYNYDIVTIQYDKLNGAQDWFHVYINDNNMVNRMVIDSAQNIFITGHSYNTGTYNDILVLKYSDKLISVGDQIENVSLFFLDQNYPNPFNPVTKIRFNIPSIINNKLPNVKIVVYDILGRELMTLINEKLAEGSYEVEFDGSSLANGIYFYSLITDEFSVTKKMILLK